MATREFKRIPFDVTINAGNTDEILATVPTGKTWLVNKYIDQILTVTATPDAKIEHRDSGAVVIQEMEDLSGPSVEAEALDTSLFQGITMEADDDIFLNGISIVASDVIRLRGAIYVLEITP